MPTNDDTTAVAPKSTRKRKATGGAATARASRHGYKKEAEGLRAEVERLKAKITRLEARPDASFESSLILRTATDSFKHGVETGLMLQDATK